MTFALVDAAGRLLEKEHAPTAGGEGAEAVLGRIRAGIGRLLEAAQRRGAVVKGIGLGVPGLIDREAGVSVLSPNLGWRNVAVRQVFEEAFGLPVDMENDVRCAALGEKRFGAGRDVDDAVLITLGTGIGSGVFIGGRLLRGPGGFAGEVGHQTIVPDGPICGCGNAGCVEALAGAPAIIRRAQAAYTRMASPVLRELVHDDPARITPAVLHQAAEAGDPLAARILEDTGRYVGIAMANVVNILNPQRVIVGGGVAQAGEWLLGPMRREIRRRSLDQPGAMAEVVPAALGPDAGVIGAAWLLDPEPAASLAS